MLIKQQTPKKGGNENEIPKICKITFGSNTCSNDDGRLRFYRRNRIYRRQHNYNTNDDYRNYNYGYWCYDDGSGRRC